MQLEQGRFLPLWRAAHRLLPLSLLIAVAFGASPAWAKPCALPTKSELGSLDPAPERSWNYREWWIWSQTLAGEAADFNQLYCEKEPLNPSAGNAVWQNPAKSGKPRQVSERFLLDVLTKKRFVEAMPSRGLRIVGALFSDPIDLSGVDFNRQIRLNRSRFIGPVSLAGARLGSSLSFEGSAFQDNVALTGAKIGGQLSAIGSTFEDGLDMAALEVGLALILSKGTFKGHVSLLGAKVGGQLSASGSTFEDGLDMDSLEVGQTLYLRGEATFKGEVRLIGAKVGGSLDLSDATFHRRVNVTNAVIEGELRLGSSRLHSQARWEPAASLVLRNTSASAIHDTLRGPRADPPQDAWPASQHLQLDGFTYKRLGGLGGEYNSEMINRPTFWYSNWLRRSASFSPQPYRQLASVFREAGADGKANEILYELRDREREEAWRQHDYSQWLKLGALKLVVGYGIGGGYFLALLWAGIFTLAGACILWSGSKMAREQRSRLVRLGQSG